MHFSRPKLSILQPYSQYFVQNDYLPQNECKLINSHYKTHSHNRKTSQVSTLSCKSKNPKTVFSKKKNHSLTKHASHNIVCIDKKTQKTTKASQKQSVHIKQFSLQKIRISIKDRNTISNRKQKLKIDTQRKAKPKTTQNLTSRYIKYDTAKQIFKNPNKSHKSSQSSFGNKCDQTQQKGQSDQNNPNNQKIFIPKFQIRQKKLDLIVSRCSKVMTEYYERITLLKKQNQFLKFQNQQLKKKNAEIF